MIKISKEARHLAAECMDRCISRGKMSEEVIQQTVQKALDLQPKAYEAVTPEQVFECPACHTDIKLNAMAFPDEPEVRESECERCVQIFLTRGPHDSDDTVAKRMRADS